MQNTVPQNSRQKASGILPSQQEAREEKPLFRPTGYPDGSVYGPVLQYNGFTVFIKRSAMHAQVHATGDFMMQNNQLVS